MRIVSGGYALGIWFSGMFFDLTPYCADMGQNGTLDERYNAPCAQAELLGWFKVQMIIPGLVASLQRLRRLKRDLGVFGYGALCTSDGFLLHTTT